MPAKRKTVATKKTTKATKPKKQKRDFSQVALSVVEQATESKLTKSIPKRYWKRSGWTITAVKSRLGLLKSCLNLPLLKERRSPLGTIADAALVGSKGGIQSSLAIPPRLPVRPLKCCISQSLWSASRF